MPTTLQRRCSTDYVSRAHRPEEAIAPICLTSQLSYGQAMNRTSNDLNTTYPLTALEDCQVLMDVAQGKRIMIRSSIQSWSEIYTVSCP